MQILKKYMVFNYSEPDFVAAYEIEDFLYFFLRESALEHHTCGKSIYSRVARICKVGTLSTICNSDAFPEVG